MTPYRPAAWLPNPHLMTIYGRVARLPPRLSLQRERWDTPDGDFLDVERAEVAPDAPLAVILHGLEGNARAPYVLGLAAALRRRGIGALAVNFRGCSGELNVCPRFYHSGETGDLAAVVERLAAERPGRPLLLAGFSLGGNVAAKYLAEQGAAARVKAGVVVSVPFDLARCAEALDAPSPWSRLYRGVFLRSLKQKAIAKARRFPETIDARAAAAARTFREFDGLVTAPLHGFASADDYWARCSSGPLLGNVARPLLALAAEDDPFVPAATLPRGARAPVTLEVTPAGGHLAFIAGAPWAPERWAEERAAEFLAESVGTA